MSLKDHQKDTATQTFFLNKMRRKKNKIG